VQTAFNYFSFEARGKAKDLYPDLSQTDITKKGGSSGRFDGGA